MFTTNLEFFELAPFGFVSQIFTLTGSPFVEPLCGGLTPVLKVHPRIVFFPLFFPTRSVDLCTYSSHSTSHLRHNFP